MFPPIKTLKYQNTNIDIPKYQLTSARSLCKYAMPSVFN